MPAEFLQRAEFPEGNRFPHRIEQVVRERVAEWRVKQVDSI